MLYRFRCVVYNNKDWDQHIGVVSGKSCFSLNLKGEFSENCLSRCFKL